MHIGPTKLMYSSASTRHPTAVGCLQKHQHASTSVNGQKSCHMQPYNTQHACSLPTLFMLTTRHENTVVWESSPSLSLSLSLSASVCLGVR